MMLLMKKQTECNVDVEVALVLIGSWGELIAGVQSDEDSGNYEVLCCAKPTH